MTLRDMLNTGVTFKGHINIKCLEEGNMHYSGNFENTGTKAIQDVLDREIRYIYPDAYGIRIEVAPKEN